MILAMEDAKLVSWDWISALVACSAAMVWGVTEPAEVEACAGLASGDGAGDRLWLDFDCFGSFLDRLVSDNDMSFLTASGLLAPNLELACPTLFFPSEKVEETRLGVGDGGRPPPDPTDLSDGVLPM